MRALIITTVLAGLAGCETMQAQPDPHAAFRSARDQVSQECGAGTPHVAQTVLGDKLANVSGKTPSLQQLADKSTPTEPEKAALLALSEQRDRCRVRFAEVHDQYGHSAVSSILRASHPALRATYAELYAGEISYGEANRRFDEIGAKVSDSIAAYGRAIDAQQAHEAEQRRLAAIQMLQQRSLANRPTTTNCVRYGVQVSCTTQ